MTWLFSSPLLAAVVAACLLSIACQGGLDLARPDISAARERGLVIDGMCPAQAETVRVGPMRDRSHSQNEMELHGAASVDGIELDWTAPAASGVDGYVIARHQIDAHGDIVAGSVRRTKISSPSGSGQHVDDDDLLPAAQYRYRVFPLTGGRIWYPSTPLDI